MSLDGHRYSLQYARNGKERWQCSRRSYYGCKAVIRRCDGVLFFINTVHNHPPLQQCDSNEHIEHTTFKGGLEDLLVEAKEFCPVCGDVTSGIHYGVHTCESCKLFFKRTIQQQKEDVYTCTAHNMCDINIQSRSWCRHCRFNKCLYVGMQTCMVRKRRVCQPPISNDEMELQQTLTSQKHVRLDKVDHNMKYQVGHMAEWGVIPRYSWSRHGNAIIMLGEYRFKKRSRHQNQKHETHWVCNKCDKGCKARLTTLNDAIVKMHNVHQHGGTRKLK